MRQCEHCGAYLDPEEHCDCQSGEILDKDIVRVMKAVFPGYDQPMHSKVKQPDKYGVMRTPRAEELLNIAFPSKARTRRRRDKRKLENQHTFRLDDAEEGRLQTAMEHFEVEHLQDFIVMVLRWFYENHGMLQIPTHEKNDRLPVQQENGHSHYMA